MKLINATDDYINNLRNQINALRGRFNLSAIDIAELQALERELDNLTGKYVVITGIFTISSETDSFTLYFIDSHDIKDIDYYIQQCQNYFSVYFEDLPIVVESISSIRRTNTVEFSVVSGVAIAEFEEIGPKRPKSIHARHGRRTLTRRFIDIDTGTFGYIR